MSPDQVLRRAAVILRSDPGLRNQFLKQIGVPLQLTVHYWDGEEHSSWKGDPEEWPEVLKKAALAMEIPPQDVFDGEDHLGWTVHSWSLSLSIPVLRQHVDLGWPTVPYDGYLEAKARGLV